MGPDVIIIMPQAGEQNFIKALIPQTTIEAFDKAVLHWLARRDIVPIDKMVLAPPENGMGGHLGPVVSDNGLGFAAFANEDAQLSRQAMPPNGGIGNKR
jgi:hypothetical protein